MDLPSGPDGSTVLCLFWVRCGHSRPGCSPCFWSFLPLSGSLLLIVASCDRNYATAGNGHPSLQPAPPGSCQTLSDRSGSNPEGGCGSRADDAAHGPSCHRGTRLAASPFDLRCLVTKQAFRVAVELEADRRAASTLTRKADRERLPHQESSTGELTTLQGSPCFRPIALMKERYRASS